MKRAWWITAIVVLLASSTAFLGYIGYFGGSVFTLVPAATPTMPTRRGVAAVLLSGDMGFNIGMGPQVAKRLAADGIPVVGVNSLVYFRARRTPAEAETLIEQAMDRALALPGTTRIVLIGQSFGGDMLHVGLAQLPAARRARIAAVAFVVPGDTVDFRASPSELFSLAPPDGPALPTARQLNWVPVLCIHGLLETNSLCPQFTLPNVKRVGLPGGHPLHRDVERVNAEIISFIDQVLAR